MSFSTNYREKKNVINSCFWKKLVAALITFIVNYNLKSCIEPNLTPRSSWTKTVFTLFVMIAWNTCRCKDSGEYINGEMPSPAMQGGYIASSLSFKYTKGWVWSMGKCPLWEFCAWITKVLLIALLRFAGLCWYVMLRKLWLFRNEHIVKDFFVHSARFHIWHAEIDCNKFQSLKQNESEREDLMLMELAKNKCWTRCPKCNLYVEKIDGCWHITCRFVMLHVSNKSSFVMNRNNICLQSDNFNLLMRLLLY